MLLFSTHHGFVENYSSKSCTVVQILVFFSRQEGIISTKGSDSINKSTIRNNLNLLVVNLFLFSRSYKL